MKNKILDFVKLLLSSYGAILFCTSYLTGFIFLLATFVNVKAGLLGLIGGIFSIFFAYKMKIPADLIKSGIFGCNGILIGLSWGYYFNLNLSIILLLIVAVFLSNKLILFLINKLSIKHGLPALSISFVLFAWCGIIIFKISKMSTGDEFILTYSRHLENYLINVLPYYFQVMLKTVSSTFFQNSVLIGLLAFLGILFYSRISFMFALASAGIIYLILHRLGFQGHDIAYLGFNSIFTSLALGGFFLRYGFNAAIFTFFAVILTLFMSLAFKTDLSYFKLPILAASFNLTTLILLMFLKSNERLRKKYNFKLIDLDKVKKPEDNLEYSQAASQISINFSLPFYGVWKVSQGNNGRYTHKGVLKYALDFWVIDNNKATFKLLGLKLDDYYSFGLPVSSPADGKVMEVVNNIPNNMIGKPNEKQAAGNHIIIEHNGIYSEISHFNPGSILVKEGDFVKRGQILGSCGNSGQSYQPHIHFQIQTKPSIGANTHPFKLKRFVKVTPEGFEVKINKIPQEGDLIKNFEDDFNVVIDIKNLKGEEDIETIYFIDKLKKKPKTETWRICGKNNKNLISISYNCYKMEEKDDLLLFKKARLFNTGNFDKFIFGFYKIPKFLRLDTIWILEENILNWLGLFHYILKGRLFRSKVLVKNKYLGRYIIKIKNKETMAHKFSSVFNINRDTWLKEIYFADDIGFVKMLIFKNNKLVKDLELTQREC